MTEEKYKELKSLKDNIEKLEWRLCTIERLLESENLGIEIKGTSTDIFKSKKFLYIDGDDYIKSILESEKIIAENNLSILRQEFENK